jgi:hypothetical protein
VRHCSCNTCQTSAVPGVLQRVAGQATNSLNSRPTSAATDNQNLRALCPGPSEWSRRRDTVILRTCDYIERRPECAGDKLDWKQHRRFKQSADAFLGNDKTPASNCSDVAHRAITAL